MEQREYDRKKFISTLMKIGHGDLKAFLHDGLLASKAEPELFAHFIAWNEIKGKVRDSKVAYPVIALRSCRKEDRDLAENAVAHLMLLSPRDLVRAYNFSKELTASGRSISSGFRRLLEDGLHQYVEIRQRNPKWFDRTVLQHRNSMKRLYRIAHHKLSPRAFRILWEKDYPPDSVFAKVAALKTMTPREAASIILTEKIPFEVAVGAVPSIKDESIVLAIIEGMTGNQVVTNSKMLERLGVNKNPVLRAAYQAALNRAKDDKKLNVLKTSNLMQYGAGGASASVNEGMATMDWMQAQPMSARSLSVDPLDKGMQQDLANLQAQATRQLGNIEGDWLILGDCSGSMHVSVDLAKKIAAIITERVKGKVWLIFFNDHPHPFDVTGKTYFQINDMTQRVVAGGMTSIGCGLDYLLKKGESIDGIAIVSDGGDNTNPFFHDAYQRYCKQMGSEPTVYFFDVMGDRNGLSAFCQMNKIELQKFDMRLGTIDYYSLPNVIATLRTNQYSLVDEIMETPLMKLADAFTKREN